MEASAWAMQAGMGGETIVSFCFHLQNHMESEITAENVCWNPEGGSIQSADAGNKETHKASRVSNM